MARKKKEIEDKELTLEEIEQGIAKHGDLYEVQIWQLAFRLS